eukprot:TRINITY_DN8739_c0_g2_i4.p1 TRINITY_DN8739_c0_g2~~TRINITY_DN8739_c0_g2_i4.p1  ORF type:complete len:153 (-),score=24.37 TRINITY_DN8739_c0_g2_i4:404-862(-)
MSVLTSEDRKLLGIAPSEHDLESQSYTAGFSSWWSGDGEESESAMSGVFSRLGIETETPSGVAAWLQVSRTQRLKYFTMLTLIGFLLLGLSSLFIPLVMVRPHKFALLFTLGNLSLWSAIGFLRGPAEQLRELTSVDRVPFTLAFGGYEQGY